MEEYQFFVEHRSHGNADAMSRIPFRDEASDSKAGIWTSSGSGNAHVDNDDQDDAEDSDFDNIVCNRVGSSDGVTAAVPGVVTESTPAAETVPVVAPVIEIHVPATGAVLE